MNGDLLTGELLKRMIANATSVLRDNKAQVDALNVFPVPDGDTGTNMSLTMLSAVQEAERQRDTTVGKIADAVAMGSLMGARGNSGVILSQLFRGIARGLADYETCDASVLARALEEGVQTAYKAVMKPVEGTILTVAKEAARGASNAAKRGGSISDVWSSACRSAEAALARTPEMLPVLKAAKVVDAGGKGLVYILTGALPVLTGAVSVPAASSGLLDDTFVSPDFEITDDINIENPYDTQLLIKGTGIRIDELRGTLEAMGDSLLVVGSTEIVRVHIHTQKPDQVLAICLSYGTLSQVTIDDMREQHREMKEAAVDSMGHVWRPSHESPQEAEIKEVGLVAVAYGHGIVEVLKSLGADYVIDGGQTMNPSTEDVVRAVKGVSARKVIFLPNNSNIFLAAKQAKRLTDRRMYVVPTRSIPQGIAALLALRSEGSMEDNLKRMARAVKQVKTGEVTYAVRKSQYNGLSIREGDILGLQDGEIALLGTDAIAVLSDLMDKMIDENDEVITVFYGNGLGREVEETLTTSLSERFPHCEVEVREGGQPLYYFIASVE